MLIEVALYSPSFLNEFLDWFRLYTPFERFKCPMRLTAVRYINFARAFYVIAECAGSVLGVPLTIVF